MSQLAGGADVRRFELRRCVGAGGFGEVYQARMITASGVTRDVAVKLLLASMDVAAVARLRDEAALLAALNHRAILAVDDLVQLSGRPALVTEFVDGADLANLIRPDGTGMPAKVALEVVAEVAGALDAALTTPSPRTGRPLGLIHRDIKPGNIRVGRAGVVKLLDFGIAVSSELPREAKTGTGLVVGTMGYLAPERIEDTVVHPPSDVYALGCVLCEALSGTPVFYGLPNAAMLRLLLDDESHDARVAAHLASLADRVDPEVVELLRAALSFSPAGRPDARTFERACEDAAARMTGETLRQWARSYSWGEPEARKGSLEGQTLTGRTMSGLDVTALADDGGAPTSSPVTPPSRGASGRRNPGLVVGAVAAGLAAIALAVVLGTRGEAPAPSTPSAPAVSPAPVPAASSAATPPPAEASTAVAAAPPAAAGTDESASAPAVAGAAKPRSAAAAGAGDRKRPTAQSASAAASAEAAAPAAAAPAEDVEVSLSSFPLGAEVKIFGRTVCKTPCKTKLPVGTHLAEFTLSDGRTAQEVLAVSASSTSFGHRF